MKSYTENQIVKIVKEIGSCSRDNLSYVNTFRQIMEIIGVNWNPVTEFDPVILDAISEFIESKGFEGHKIVGYDKGIDLSDETLLFTIKWGRYYKHRGNTGDILRYIGTEHPELASKFKN